MKILFVGRLEEENGILIYLKTLDILRRKKLKHEIIFCGFGSYERQAAEYGRIKAIRSNDTYHYSKILGNTDFVFASSYLSILEAMVGKKLVFAVFDNPLKEDYLKMAPFSKWIIIETTPGALYNKLVYYTQHPEEEEKLVEEAYNWVKEQTWEKVVNLYLELWNHVSTRGSHGFR